MPRLPLVSALLLAACVGASPRTLRPRLDGRVVGGKPVNIKEFPYQLSFLYNGRHICGASIISDVYAITASHCTDGSRESAVSFRAGSDTRGSGGFVTRARAITMHPQYDYYTIDYDMAVVRVATAFPLGREGVAAVPLAAATPPAGTALLVSGWGTSSEGGPTVDKLQAVEIQVVDHEECRRAYSGFGGVSARMLCAGAAGGGRDACQGDSGGPLVAGGQLVGIVSWGVGCARPQFPGVNTDVASLRQWVAQQTGV